MPDWVARLRALEMLDRAHNALRTVPDALGDAPALEKLDLRWNDLRALPRAASALARRGCFVLW